MSVNTNVLLLTTAKDSTQTRLPVRISDVHGDVTARAREAVERVEAIHWAACANVEDAAGSEGENCQKWPEQHSIQSGDVL